MPRQITARRADECRAESCTAPSRAISAGERINYGGPGAVTHAQCEAIDAPRSSSRGRTSRRSSYGRSRYPAYRGRCEDAPCCGCCD